VNRPNTAPVPLSLVGCDFKVAPTRMRARLVLDDRGAARIADSLLDGSHADGFAEVATCNRVEWIASGGDPQWIASLLSAEMRAAIGNEGASVTPYQFTGIDAARHLLRVAIGRESLVTGERQISGQLFKALERARERGTSSRLINGLGTSAGRLVRRALREGLLGGSGRGVHGLAIDHLKANLPDMSRSRVAVVGLGAIGRRVEEVLRLVRPAELVLVNRTVAPEDAGRIRPLSDLPAVLETVDAAVVCTSALTPVIRAAQLAGRRSGAPLLIVDIGVPSQIDADGLPPSVTAVGIDELVCWNEQRTDDAVAAAEDSAAELVEGALGEFLVFCGADSLLELFATVKQRHADLVGVSLPRIVDARLADLPPELRDGVRDDLKALLVEHTNELLRTIRETSQNLAGGDR
jgi:glutamyl-tRNA reductase